MPILDHSSLGSVGFFLRGRPYINVESNNTVNSVNGKKYSFFGRGQGLDVHLFIGATGPAVAESTNNIYAKIGGAWVSISQAYVYIGTPGSGAWKSIENDKMYVKTPSGWRS